MAILVGLVLGLALSALVSLLYGLILMLTVQVVHSDWLPGVPTIGYWVAVIVAFTIRSLFTSTSVSK